MDGSPRPVTLDGTLDLDTAFQIANGERALQVSPAAKVHCANAAERLEKVILGRRHVYGITTGFGPLANRLIDPQAAEMLQQNLVFHLASGVGSPLSWVEARATLLCRLNTILQGASGASDASIQTLVGVLLSPLAPRIPQKGTVGASGDLTPLAHMVLALQGKGEFMTRDGTAIDGTRALKQMRLDPLRLDRRDGLALVNGTSAMTGTGICNANWASKTTDWAIALSAVLAEVMQARQEAWHPIFAELRPHAGQKTATVALNSRVSGSMRLNVVPLADGQVGKIAMGETAALGQDAYTLRCVPQVIGAVIDSVDHHNTAVSVELNSVTDNPIFPHQGQDIALHGGNFMGQQIALVSDNLGVAITVLAGLAERQLARLTDEKLNGGLPAFLSRATSGLSSGFMGAQVTATALLAEMRAVAPASMQSISTNGANQDVVSMGTIAARLTRDRLEACFQIQAILALALAQAMDIQRSEGGFSPNALAFHAWVRALAPEMPDDRPLGKEIGALASALARQSPPKA